MGIYKQHADNSGRRFITAFTVADCSAGDGGRISHVSATACAEKVYEFDFSRRDKKGPEMNAILKQCFQAQDVPDSYPKCSMKLLPIRE